MTEMRKPPTTVVVAAVILGLFAALFGAISVSWLWVADRTTASAGVAGVIAVLLAVLTWRVWAGSRGAQITAVVVAAAFAVSVLFGDFQTLPWLAIPGGLAIVTLLAVAPRSREYFASDHRRTQLT